MSKELLANDKTLAQQAVRLRKTVGMPILVAKNYLEHMTPTERELIVATAEKHGDGYIHDPIEDTPQFIAVIDDVKKEAKKELDLYKDNLTNMTPPELLSIALRTGVKHHTIVKRILRERYNIQWRSLVEMNTHITFD